VIRNVCSSDAWAAQRYHPRFDKACRKLIGDPNKDIERGKTPKDTFRFMVYQWRGQSAMLNAPTGDNQQIFGRDPTLALRMKRQVCGESGPYSLGVCAADELPPATCDGSAACVGTGQCEVCRAIVSSAFGVVHQSRERPTVAAGFEFSALSDRLERICADMPMREAMRNMAATAEVCQDLWEEHGSTFQSLAAQRAPEYAEMLCVRHIGACDSKMSRRQLYSFDPGKASAGADGIDASDGAASPPPPPPEAAPDQAKVEL